MDYSFEIKNNKKERVAFQTITSSSKKKILERLNEFVGRNPHLKNSGHTCTITSFDWVIGKRVVGSISL